jgi:precorrin-6Y C5,15-methyltransferase (decarboxylating)
MCYGIGVTLIQHIPFTEMRIIPAPSAFSLACARLGWSLTEVETLSLCGRDLALLNALLYLKAKILILSGDKTTPVKVAQYLTRQGYGNSQITVLERMGGPKERVTTGVASSWTLTDLADLNTIALTVLPTDPFSTSHSPHIPGLPDSAYQHDGQLTKKEVRAITLSALAPTPGQLLWDVGAGCGSIAIEWMRSGRGCRAIAIDHHPIRCQYITDNAATLGVPHLTIVVGDAPKLFKTCQNPMLFLLGED